MECGHGCSPRTTNASHCSTSFPSPSSFSSGLLRAAHRLELLTPAGDLVQADTYNKLFTMHGMVMVFFFLIPSIPAVLGNFPRAHDDRGQRSRLPARQPAELVSLRYRWRDDDALHADWRRRHRMDVLRSFSTNFTNTKIVEAGLAIFRRRVLVHPHRPQLRSHHSPHARARHDMVAPALVHLGALRHQHHSTPRHAGHRGDHCSGCLRTRAAPRHLRSQTRRRSAIVPTPVLVLFPSRGLHHDSAGNGCRYRDHRLLLAQAHFRLQLCRVLVDCHRRFRLSRLGSPHVCSGNVGVRRAGVFFAELRRRSAFRDQSFN